MTHPPDRTPLDTRGDRRQSGFTLVEMAIAVALFGMMVSGALVGLTVYFDRIAEEKSRDALTKVERAIGLYVAVNGRLPCPDFTLPADGREDRDGTGSCPIGGLGDTIEGVPAWLDLGLTKTDAIDGYGNFISYIATYDLTEDGELRCGDPYDIVNPRALLEPQENPAGESWPGPPEPPRAAYALVYHGKNGSSALGAGNAQRLDRGTAAERHNGQTDVRTDSIGVDEAGNPTSTIQKQEIAVRPNEAGFDDVIRTRTPAQILFDNGCPGA